MSMIVIGATIKAKPGMEQQLIAKMDELAKATEKEDGCLMYIFNQDTKDPGTILVYEQYRDQAAFDAHMGSDHFKTIGRAMGEFMAGRPEMKTYKKVAGFAR